MRAEQLSEALGLLEDDLIEEARQSRERIIKIRRPTWQKWVAFAACFALVAVIGWRLETTTPGPKQYPSSGVEGGNQPVEDGDPAGGGDLDLPMLTIQSGDVGAGFGFEGYLAYSIDELLDKNPWTPENTPETLPVYRNIHSYNAVGVLQPQNIDFDEMEAVLVAVAEKLEMDVDELEITDNTPDEDYKKAVTEKFALTGDEVPEGYFDPTALIAQVGGVKLTVDETLTARIDFDPPVELPEEYNFHYYATSEEMAEAAQWLSANYSGLLSDMEDPTLDQGIADRNIYGQRDFDVEYYDAGGSAEERIVHYNFDRVAFYPNDDGELFLARVYRMPLAEKLGDYPIISVEEARTLLLNGNYTTTVPYDLPGEEYIRKVELLYRTGSREKTYLPWYRFLVELPEDEGHIGEDKNLKSFGAYYVPAVEGKYITDMPMWGGEFN